MLPIGSGNVLRRFQEYSHEVLTSQVPFQTRQKYVSRPYFKHGKQLRELNYLRSISVRLQIPRTISTKLGDVALVYGTQRLAGRIQYYINTLYLPFSVKHIFKISVYLSVYKTTSRYTNSHSSVHYAKKVWMMSKCVER